MSRRPASCLPWACAALAIFLWAPARSSPAPETLPPLALHDSRGLPLLWRDVESGREWAGGVRPRFHLPSGHDVARLEPGAAVTVRLDAGSVLRVRSVDRDLVEADLEATSSRGLGLKVPLRALETSDERSLCYHAAHPWPVLIELRRPARCEGALRVGLFVSSVRFESPLRGWREVALSLTGARAPGAGRSVDLDGESWRALDPGETVALEVEGPASLAVLTRLSFPAGESAWRQSYRLRVALGGGAARDFLEETEADLQRGARGTGGAGGPEPVLGAPPVFGVPRWRRIDVPDGRQRVEIEASEGVLCRVVKRDADAFLFPSLFPFALDGVTAGRDGRVDFAPLEALLAEPAADGAALRAVMRCRALGAAVSTHPDDRRLAADLFFRHSWYRSLLPAEKLGREPPLAARFEVPRLLGTLERARLAPVPPQFAAAIADSLATAEFLVLPPAPGQLYHLPARAAESILRVAVVAESLPPGGAEIVLQFDAEPPLELAAAPQPELAGSEHYPTRRQSALAGSGPERSGLEETEPGARALLAVSFPPLPGGARSPASLVRAAVHEVEVPAGARAVRLGAREPGVAAALQILEVKPRGATELEYRGALRRAREAGAAERLFAEALASYERGAIPPPPLQELTRTWRPLLRRLEVARRRFEDAVSPRVDPGREGGGAGTAGPVGGAGAAAAPAAPAAPAALPGAASGIDAVREAREGLRLGAAGAWLPSLEGWARAGSLPDAALARRAELEIVAALEALGERFLAEKRLRGLSRSRDEALRSAARARLLATIALGGDDLELRDALSFHAATGDPFAVRALIEHLVNVGAWEDAIQLGLSLPAAEQPLELLLQASWKLRWWASFDDLQARLPDEARLLFWEGIRRAVLGDTAGALASFAGGGAEGREWAECVEAELALRAAIEELLAEESAKAPAAPDAPADADAPAAPDAPADADSYAAPRLGLFLRWVEWHVRHPGAWQWEDDATLVRDYAGAARSRAPEVDAEETYYTATASRPVRLEVLGPARLRIEARPLHAPGSEEPLEGWIEVRSPGELHPLPVSGNLPSSGLEITGEERLPGTLVRGEVALGAGLHEVEVRSGTLDLLVRPLVLRPVMTLGVLPPLAAASYRALFRGDPAALPRSLLTASDEALLAAGDLESVVRRPAAGAGAGAAAGGQGLLRKMTALLWAAEHAPEMRREAQVKGAALFAAHPDIPGLQALHSRLVRASRWRRVASVEARAGERLVEVAGWQPEDPALRARRSLLSPVEAGERVLAGDLTLGVSMTNLRPVVMEVILAVEAVDYVPPIPLVVRCELDGGEAERVVLEPPGPERRLRLEIGAGEHVLRISLEDPAPNHYLRVRVAEEAGGASLSLLHQPVRRLYALATTEEPVRVALVGPAWLRIDELRDGRTLTRYEEIPRGPSEIELSPPAGRAEALYRVFERVPALDDRAPLHASVPCGPLASAPPSPPAALFSAPPPASSPFALGADALSRLVLADAVSLGGQEDGTLSFTVSAHRRKVFDEDAGGDLKRDEFVEAHGAHRLHHEGLSTWFETGLLARGHDEAGPTLGVEERLHFRPEWLPFTLGIEATAFLQWPRGETLDPEGPSEWSATLRARVSRRLALGERAYHVPSLSVFRRLLSLDEGHDYLPGLLDQDVFTLYKDDHRHGLALSETLGYEPWLDTVWWAGGTLVSNEDFVDPDHLGLRAGWRQLFASVEVDAGYRLTRFFNDGDRSSSRTRDAIFLDFLADLWTVPGQRLEAGAEYRWDLADGEHTGFLFLSWHWGKGREYRDFWPGDIDFRPLRRRFVPTDHQNSIVEARR